MAAPERSPTGRKRGRPSGTVGPELVTLARDQFLEHGFRRTTMDAVAAKAGISKQTLYAAYPSKDALFAAVVQDWVDRGRSATAPQLAALLTDGDVEHGLRALAATLQAGILSEPVLAMRALVAAQADTLPAVAADYVSRSWERNTQNLADALATLAEQGRLAIPDAAVAAEQFVWLVVGAPLNRLELTAGRDRLSDDRLAQLAEEGVRTFLSRYGR
ncbi:TetR/AcrR family transcriptional regulator [Pseudonocardia sp. CA-107938]|uniref:TetR/AcrR family transcriptional regulator n=1 Tax=Pseudonocardia sp. CA-107938 TaxID=3240021 RepID=UPI003D8AFCDC